MKITKFILKFIVIISILAAIIWTIWGCLFAIAYFGISPDKAEAYVIDIKTHPAGKDITSSDIVDLLYQFQCSHPQYRLMAPDTAGNAYHYFSPDSDCTAKQRMVFFYFADIDILLSCITEISPCNRPLIKLYYVNEGTVIRDYQEINNYEKISRKKNRMIKKKFETEILNSLGVKWRHKRIWD